jgi:hypothetical protein
LSLRSRQGHLLLQRFFKLRKLEQVLGRDAWCLGGFLRGEEDEVELTRVTEDDLFAVAAKETEEGLCPSLCRGKRELRELG